MTSRGTYTYRVDSALSGAEAFRLLDVAHRFPFSRMRRLVLSLAGVERIDASGIAVLVRLFSRLRRLGIALELCDVPVDVAMFLGHSGLTGVLPVVAAPRAESAAALTAPPAGSATGSASGLIHLDL